MAVRNITTKIAVDGEQEFKKQMGEVNRELRNLKSEMGLVEAEFKGQANSVEALTRKDELLRKEIEQQQEKIKALAQAVVDAEQAFGKTDKRTDEFRRSLNYARADLIKMNQELEDTDKYLKEAEDAADGCATSIDGFGKSTKESGGFLAEYGDKLKMLGAAGVAGAAVKGLQEIAGAVLEVEESTREYRQIMGTLEASSQAAGYTAEETAQVYERLYGVLGDTQTAATTVANLQAIGLEQEELKNLVDASIGAWAEYGDSIPIDQMAESINLAVQQSEVSSALADAIEWSGGSVEEFTARLEGAYSAQDRARILMEELTARGLPELGQAWFDLNEDIVSANESQLKLEASWARLGESLAPVADAIRTFGAEAIGWLADLVDDALSAFVKFGDAASGFLFPSDSQYAQRSSATVDGSHAGGLDYVPFDGYVAQLHRGERILTATENAALSRSERTASSPQILDVTLNIDGRRLSRFQHDLNKAEAARRGASYVSG